MEKLKIAVMYKSMKQGKKFNLLVSFDVTPCFSVLEFLVSFQEMNEIQSLEGA